MKLKDRIEVIIPAERIKELSEYYFSVKLKELESLRKQGHEIINLGIGSPDLSPDNSVITALHESSSDSKNHGYQPYNGTYELRKTISDWLEQYFNISRDPHSEILPLLGSKEGILHTSMAFLNPGDLVLIPEIGYPAYRSISTMAGGRILEYPLTSEFCPDFKNFSREMKTAKLLWCNYPHMPTGTTASFDVFEQLVKFGKENNVLICHDNPYPFILNKERISIFEIDNANEVTLELHSLSKSHNMAGWRVGWVTANSTFIENILKIKSNINSGMFRGVQDAATAALSLPYDWHQNQDKEYSNRQKIGFDILKELNCSFNKDQAGMFVWGKLNNSKSSEQFVDELLYSKHIFITPGTLFGKAGDGYVRISLCSDITTLTKTLNRLRN